MPTEVQRVERVRQMHARSPLTGLFDRYDRAAHAGRTRRGGEGNVMGEKRFNSPWTAHEQKKCQCLTAHGGDWGGLC